MFLRRAFASREVTSCLGYFNFGSKEILSDIDQ